MRQALDTYDDMPKYMKQYLRNYGWHFNKALCNYAVSLMKKGGQKLEPVSKEYVDKTLEQYNIQLEKNVGCDYIFVANMCKADYYGSSITDEKHFALYIKDTIDETELRCIDVDCVDFKSISCSKCPLSLQNEKGLFEGEFKILELEDNE